MTNKFKLTKPDGTKKVFFADCHGDFLTMPESNKPFWNKTLSEKAGLVEDIRKRNPLLSQLNEKEKSCLLIIGRNNDGSLVERLESEKEKRDRQNAFLRQHGYHWKKEWQYVGCLEDMYEHVESDGEGSIAEWVLRGRDGKQVTDLEMLLAELGFSDSKPVEELKAERTEKNRISKQAAKKEKICKEKKQKIDDYFHNTEGYTPNPDTKPNPEIEEIQHFARLKIDKGFSIYGTGTEYVVTENAIWRIQNNGMDGDFWGANNYRTGGAGAIATKFPRDEDIANLIVELSK